LIVERGEINMVCPADRHIGAGAKQRRIVRSGIEIRAVICTKDIGKIANITTGIQQESLKIVYKSNFRRLAQLAHFRPFDSTIFVLT
jgi:hypothetical protein